MSKPEQMGGVTTGMHSRLARELKTVQAMIRIYCRAHHKSSGGLCSGCRELSDYAEKRLAACPFQEHKPACGKCPVHCYRPAMREKIIEVMRFSGPKMIFQHPFLACAHLMDERRSGKQEKLIGSRIRKKR